MIKTTVQFEPPQYQQIMFLARQHETTKAAAIRQLVAEALGQRKDAQRKQLFTALHKVKGSVSSADPNFAETVDQTLYGNNGPWQAAHN